MRVRSDLITCYVARSTADGRSQEFLQLHRSPGDFMANTWQAISGGIEVGETAWQAALRELREEAALVPVEFYRLPIVNTFYIAEQDTLWHSIAFCAIVSRSVQVILNEEHNAIRWIAREQVHADFMWATDRSAIDELCRSILDNGPAKPHLRIALP